jgi:hypothetical protein
MRFHPIAHHPQPLPTSLTETNSHNSNRKQHASNMPAKQSPLSPIPQARNYTVLSTISTLRARTCQLIITAPLFPPPSSKQKQSQALRKRQADAHWASLSSKDSTGIGGRRKNNPSLSRLPALPTTTTHHPCHACLTPMSCILQAMQPASMHGGSA